MPDLTPDEQRTPQGVRIESNGVGGCTGDTPNTRVTVDGIDVTPYVLDVSWAIGLGGWGYQGGDLRARADIRYHTVMLDALAPIDPERAETIQRVRDGHRPGTLETKQLLDELDQARARAAALQAQAEEQAAALAAEREEHAAETQRMRDAIERVRQIAWHPRSTQGYIRGFVYASDITAALDQQGGDDRA